MSVRLTKKKQKAGRPLTTLSATYRPREALGLVNIINLVKVVGWIPITPDRKR